MTSKSELKRMATVDPLGTAERLAELEQGVRSWERQALINMDNYQESKTEVNHLVQVVGEKNARIAEFRRALRDIQGHCGHPDAAEACRIILKRITEVLGEK